MALPQKTYTLNEAKLKLEHFCVYQERCHKEVIQKLKAMHMISDAIDTIVTHLITHNFLNETRFAKHYARGKFNIKNWGKVKIERELKLRDISKFNIKVALGEITDEDYFNKFEEITLKKANGILERNPLKKKKKFADYFLYRGWESHLVYDRAQELIDKKKG